MEQKMKFTLPEGLPIDGDFPETGYASPLTVARQVFRKAAREAGFQETGCSYGRGDDNDGEADIGLRIDGRRVEVLIYLPRVAANTERSATRGREQQMAEMLRPDQGVAVRADPRDERIAELGDVTVSGVDSKHYMRARKLVDPFQA
jgi:hypothetical protein